MLPRSGGFFFSELNCSPSAPAGVASGCGLDSVLLCMGGKSQCENDAAKNLKRNSASSGLHNRTAEVLWGLAAVT